VLGVPHFDRTRFKKAKFPMGNYDGFAQTPMDRPSLYLGGLSQYECDVGLTWDRIYRSDGLPVYTDVDGGDSGGDFAHEFYVVKENDIPLLLRRSDRKEMARGHETVQAAIKDMMPAMAYRPYWRAFDSVNGNFWNTEPITRSTNVYFYPTQEITMELRVVGYQRMHLSIRGVWNNEQVNFEKDFEQLRWGPGRKTVWKRVNSIDQEGTEGKGVISTQSSVTGAHWKRVYLLKSDSVTVPFSCDMVNIERGNDIIRGYARIFKYSEPDRATGASRIDITP
jgi:hypothetical protein